MSLKANPRLALLGNPNCGKTSLFNHLTRQHQRTGNFTGVTVDKKVGYSKLNEHMEARVIDLPGAYSIYPHSQDEQIVSDLLGCTSSPDYPDILLVVLDACHLKRSLLLLTEVRDLGFPVLAALTKVDAAAQQGIEIDLRSLKEQLGMQIKAVNTQSGEGIEDLKYLLSNPQMKKVAPYYDVTELAPELIGRMRKNYGWCSSYRCYQMACHFESIKWCGDEDREFISQLRDDCAFDSTTTQGRDTIGRYTFIDKVIESVVTLHRRKKRREQFTDMIDRYATHRYWGFGLLFALFFIVFQSIYIWTAIPGSFIRQGADSLASYLAGNLNPSVGTSLLIKGLLPATELLLVVLPQLAILFLCLTLLEESGYMARVAFLTDKIMRRFGMSGKCLMPLLSGVSFESAEVCRSTGRRGRFMAFLLHHSARIPLYMLLVALFVPTIPVLTYLNLQGIVLMALYLAGIVVSIGVSYLVRIFLNTQGIHSLFMMELPVYSMPNRHSVGVGMYEKFRHFGLEAGRLILLFLICLVMYNALFGGDMTPVSTAAAKVNDADLLAGILSYFSL
ncbi:FeoB small GTPase domain-containing protein [Roseivirga sp. BDSF3-8]|uniref:FeoB small GTPase domain-containing protein n=1 Tax=Roseivirga sp. BDSF3-8 TaxID=3241598 RepID=UPI003531FD49